MKRRVPFVASLMLAGAVTACAPPAPAPSASGHPATRTVDVVGDYHGTEVPDPYRWLESLDSPEVRAWAAAQTSHALAHLRATDAGSRLLARMDALQEFFSEPPGAPPGEPLEPAPPLVPRNPWLPTRSSPASGPPPMASTPHTWSRRPGAKGWRVASTA